MRDELMLTVFPRDGNESKFEENGYAHLVLWEITTKVLNDKLVDYNDSHTVMNLALFKDAIEYVVRISRGITARNGHMLLVGLGGSGKQSLTRLAASLSGYTVFQIALANNYGVPEFQADLVKVFTQAGSRKQPTVFLLTDSQVLDERFLIFISDYLSTGVLPYIFAQKEKEIIYNAVKDDMKIAAIQSPRRCM
jgi:dynein heavy chain